jgi:hypothetical protein
VVVLALAALASPAAAQPCVGLPSFAGATRVSGGASFADSSSAYSAALGGSTARGLFGDLGAGVVQYEGVSGRTTYGFASAGMRATPERWPVQVCGVAGASHGKGPKGFSGTGTDVAITTAVAGVAAGLPVTVSRMFRVVPNGTVTWQYAETKLVVDDLPDQRASGTSGVLDLGVGIVFYDRVSVQPAWQLPFGGDDAGRTLSVTASVRLTRR